MFGRPCMPRNILRDWQTEWTNQLPGHRFAITRRSCEQGDILIEHVDLPRVEVGDLIAIPCAGAYQIPMASNYNLIPRPAVLAVRRATRRPPPRNNSRHVEL